MSFLILEFIQYFFLHMVLNRVTRILKFFSRCKFFVHHQLGFSPQHSKIQVEKKNHVSRLSKSHLSFTNKTIIEDGKSVRRDEMELVMANLGIFCHPESDEKLPVVLTSTDLFNIFEEEQPRLDEVKEAFDVFDENKDGFIDARELQRVLCALGMKERADMENCKKMIGAFDENADGRIDFNEFVKFMETTCC